MQEVQEMAVRGVRSIKCEGGENALEALIAAQAAIAEAAGDSFRIITIYPIPGRLVAWFERQPLQTLHEFVPVVETVQAQEPAPAVEPTAVPAPPAAPEPESKPQTSKSLKGKGKK